jgi:hypothetical protein
MVSDAMAIIVFLSLPVPGVFFPLGKSNLPVFFTVKYFFFKIKSWPDRAGQPRKREEGFQHEKI